MTRDPSTLEQYLPPKDRREILGLIQKSFGLSARFLTGLEFETTRSGFVIPCSVKRTIGCQQMPCTRRSLGLQGAIRSEECLEGLRWGFAPLDLGDGGLAYIQVGPFFTSEIERRKLLATRPELSAFLVSYPIVPDPENGVLKLISQWVREQVLSRYREHELARKETLLLTVVDSTQRIASMSNSEDLLDYLADISLQLTDACSAFILTREAESGGLKLVAARGVGPEINRGYRVPRGHGITGWVLERGEHLYVPDVEKDDRFIRIGNHAACELAVPVKSGDQVVGVLAIDSATPNAFSTYHVKMLEGLASQVSVVLDSLSHRVDGEARLRQLTALHKVSQVLNSRLEISNLLEGVLSTISEVYDGASCSVLISTNGKGRMLIRSPDRDQASVIDGIDLSSDRGILGYVIRSREPLLLNPESGELFERFRSTISSDISSIISAPLASAREMFGTVFVASPASIRYGQEELDLLSTIAHVVSQAVERGRLFEKSQRQIAELSVLNEMGKAVNSSLDLDQVLDYAVSMIGSIIEASSGSIMLLNKEARTLAIVAGKNVEARFRNLELKVGEGLAGWVAEHRAPIMLADARKDPRYLKLHAEDSEPSSILAVPIMNRETVLGVMSFERPGPQGKPFDEDDLNLVRTLASQAAVAIDNASLYRGMIQVHFETIQSLANALEAKDPYTHGHSRRVSKDAVRIAQRLRLPPKEIETIRHAALLHDIGKIGVRDSVLLKPGPLSDDEFNHIKRHAQLGASILQSIEHLKEVARFVRHHHERVDGQGYPYRLRSEEIPLGSKIICICDSFDAMITTRPYREGMPIEKAVEQLMLGRGTQFDSQLVDVFVDILKEHHPSLRTRIAPAQLRHDVA